MSTSNKGQRIGLLGGTFDPVHKGHIEVAKLAEKTMSLDRVIFIPAADPPHKKRPGASYSHRVAMLEIALAAPGHEKFEISLLEAERKAPSYTIDTLIEMKKRLGEQRFYFIIGADSLLELHLWYRFQELPELTDFIVAARPGISMQEIEKALEKLAGPFIPDPPNVRWRRMDGAKIYYLADVSNNISSTTIRMQIRDGVSPDTIDRRVLDHIMVHGLYR